MTKALERVHFSSAQIIIAGFATVILLGAALLTLPFASREAGSANFSDALFTATSAVCVTGLVVHDTALHWSEFGQFVILLLIQIGGMGVVTVAVAITMISGRKISLMQRSTMQEAISAHHVGGVVRLTVFIVRTSFLIELLGAGLLAFVFVPEFGVGQGAWYAIFHSVSAFCNAGFDLMGVRAPYSSLTAYAASPVVCLTIAGLIVVGGIGFLTWEDVRTHGVHLRAYRLQSKVILCVTLGLIVLPAAYFYAFELPATLPAGERVLSALFQSITPRTAGFNTVDLTALSEVGQMVLVMLMLIGGSPGSTAGGMKTTTFAVLVFSAAAVFRRREEPRCFGRRIDAEAIRNAAAILLLYLSLFLLGGLAISAMEDLPVVDCLFEAASAIGTVGLSLGLTPGLGQPSRAILIALMFFGRVGGLTLIFAALSGKRPCASKLPREKITVG